MRYELICWRTWLLFTVLCCLLVSACGDSTELGPKEQQAIQIAKASTSDSGFSVVSNIEKRAEDNRRQGNPWTMGPWEAGFPSQKDRILETLSQYFNIFRPTGDYWVRFTYSDKDGTREALWDVNIYTKEVVAKNQLAQSFASNQ